MNLLNRIIINLILGISLIGCASQKPMVKYEYVEVKVPVKPVINKPARPTYNKSDSIPAYLLKLLTYTKKLEVIIDENSVKE